MLTKKYRFGKAKDGAKAVHEHTLEGEHKVGIGNLRVFVMPDGEFWFAKGFEIDYATQGSTPEEAKDNFAQGLAETIDLHIQMYGTIERLLAPSDVIQELMEANSIELDTSLSLLDIGIRSSVDVNDLLLDRIQYYRVEQEAA
jgi:hypothetical protein